MNVTEFAQALISFGQLEELDLFSFDGWLDPVEFELNLPILKSIHFEYLRVIKTLNLDAPRLQKIKLVDCPHLSLVFVHGESVERLLTHWLGYTAVKNLMNLKYLYTGYSAIDSTLLSGLKYLKVFHLNYEFSVLNLFEQKRRYGLADLKIYLCSLFLNCPDDLAIDSLMGYNNIEAFVHLAENRSRLADEIPFHDYLDYSAIERVDPGLAIDVLSRFTDFRQIEVDEPVQDIERFLDVLKNFGNIEELEFCRDQPQDLFDRLPEHSAVQKLVIHGEPSDFEFLPRLNHLIELDVNCSIDAELIREVFEGLPFLLRFKFCFNRKEAVIGRNFGWTNPKRFRVELDWYWTDVPDLNAAIQLVSVGLS